MRRDGHTGYPGYRAFVLPQPSAARDSRAIMSGAENPLESCECLMIEACNRCKMAAATP